MSGRPAEGADRRKRTRMQVHWPLRFINGDTTGIVNTVTYDLSSDGFYCVTRLPFVPGELKVCALDVPTSHPKGDERIVSADCTVRIIRVEVLEDGLYGVGCRIENYRFVRPSNGHDRHGA
jgi:hypothetical protein